MYTDGMATWRVGKSTVVHSGGLVVGPEDDGLTFDLGSLQGGYARIRLAPPNSFVVDPASDWMIDRFVAAVAQSYGVDVDTDYRPKASDIPASVRAYLARVDSDGVVY